MIINALFLSYLDHLAKFVQTTFSRIDFSSTPIAWQRREWLKRFNEISHRNMRTSITNCNQLKEKNTVSGHTCKKRVMLRGRLFWPKKIAEKVRKLRQNEIATKVCKSWKSIKKWWKSTKNGENRQKMVLFPSKMVLPPSKMVLPPS